MDLAPSPAPSKKARHDFFRARNGLKMYFYQKNPVLLSKKVTDEGGIPQSTDKLFDKKGGTD